MVDLSTQNYIHALFLYEFGVSFNVITTVRFYLQQNLQKRHLYYQWIKNRILRTNMPTFEYTDSLVLFESDAEKDAYDNWLYSSIEERPKKLKPNHMILHRSNFNVDLSLNYNSMGNACYENPSDYQLTVEDITMMPRFFQLRRYKGYQLPEQDFYNLVNELLSTVESTQKIPFDHYIIK